jgi:hypothetical protein
MRNRTALLAAVLSIFLLFGPTGCRHQYPAPDMCRSSTPYRVGEEQAMRGQPIDYSMGRECSGDGLAEFTASLEEGYRAGQQRYCDPLRARAAGMEDGVMHRPPSWQPQTYAICPDVPALHAAYGQGHQEGLERLCQPGPFEEVGNKHGAEGLPSLIDISKFPMCGAARLPALDEAYTRGYQRGLASFCAPGRWEAVGREVGNRGDAPAEVRGSVAHCPAEQQELIVSHYERGYQGGLANFCEPASWEPWAHGPGAKGRRAPDVRGEIERCSAAQQNAIAFHVRRGYEAGLRTYCASSEIVNAARAAARDGSAPALPDEYIVCLDVFPETQMLFASGYQTELTWMQQQWGSRPPMLPAQFRELVQYVQSHGSDSDRLQRMKAAAQHNYFTSDQVRLLMQQLTYENDRVEIAATLYPVVVDRTNWDQVYDLLYLHGQAALRERIAVIP